MAEKTLYDILEVSETASYDIIRAAYERLMKRFEPVEGTPDTAVYQTAVKEAFFTLGNPQKRAAYDRRLQAQAQALTVPATSNTSKYLIAALIAVAAFGGYMRYTAKKEEARLEHERVVAAEKAREAEALAAAEALRLRGKQVNSAVEDRATRQRDHEIARFQYELRVRETEIRNNAERERYAKETSERTRRNEEQAAVRAAQARVERERAELCRLERSRYGRSISC